MKPKKIEIAISPYQKEPVPIVADAAISTRGAFGGHLLPLLILDTSNRPDIDELIRVHQTLQVGDSKALWGQVEDHDGYVVLLLTFVRPVETIVLLEFNIAKQGILVEQMLVGRGLYIQSGRDGDRFIKDPARPKVLIEIPDTGFKPIWNDLFHKYLAEHFRTKGLSRSDAKSAAQSAINEWRKFGEFRMRDVPLT